MKDGLLYLASSFWLGALHAATPGHGKTIAAAYIVGARGRPVDALVLGIFVTLSHTSGIVLVALLATLGSAWFIPHRIEAYVACVTGVLVISIGLWLLVVQWRAMLFRPAPDGHEHCDHEYEHEDAHEHASHEHAHPQAHHHRREDPGEHGDPREHGHADHEHPHHDGHGNQSSYHRHGWGPAHAHEVAFDPGRRPSLSILLGLGIAGGLLPDPGGLAVLLAALASGKMMLGLFTVLTFSVGFASVLVLVGAVAALVGDLVLVWLDSQWMGWLQTGTATLIVLVGVVLTVNAVRGLVALT
jgi:nickel/cobalt transporter (NicO) family protein